jgi:tetratricopeptide (TPR) repeat protein
MKEMFDTARITKDALSLVRRGDHVGARPALEEVLGRVPLDFRARYVLALVELAAGDLVKSEFELRLSLLIDPRPGSHWHHLARLIRDPGRLHERCVYLEWACVSDPSSPIAHSHLAAVSPAAGKPRRALAAYRRAIMLRPKDQALLRRYADFMITELRRRDRGAIDIARAVLLEDPSYLIGYRFLYSNMMASVDPRLVRLSAERSILAGGMDHLGFWRFGKILREQGSPDQSRANFKRASLLNPAQPEFYVSHFYLSRNRADADYAARILLMAWYSLPAEAGPGERTKLLRRLAEIRRALQDPGAVPGWIEVQLLAPNLEEKDARVLKQELARLRMETGELNESERLLASLAADEIDKPSTYLLAERSCLLYASGKRAEYRKLSSRDFIKSYSITDADPTLDVARFNASLRRLVIEHPTLRMLYDGGQGGIKQTKDRGAGSLLEDPAADLARLRDCFNSLAVRYVSELATDPDHPFLRHKEAAHRLSIFWGLVMEQCHESVAHTHEAVTFITAIYYASETGGFADPGDPTAGWLEVMRPNLNIEMEEADILKFHPTPGTFIFLPAYLYHRPLPTNSDQTRVSIVADFNFV